MDDAPKSSQTTLTHAELHLTYKLANAPINSFPYPHCYIPEVFPTDFYAEMQRQLPDPMAMIPIEQARGAKGYKERFVLELNPARLSALPETRRNFWSGVAGWMLSGRLQQLMLGKFGPFMQRTADAFEFYADTMLIQDITDYKIGPHCDAPGKVITMLFYLPADDSQAHLGTSIYTPKDPAFTCPTGTHHPPDGFNRVVTMPFLPNSLFTFVRSDTSFHGVEPVGDPDCRRWLLLFTIYARPRA
jgi:hypothetical protein